MKVLHGILLLLVVAVISTEMVERSGAVFTSGTGAPRNAFSAAADWTGPTVTMGNPGSPLRGTVTISATAADAVGSVSAVRIQRSAAGSGQWTDVCSRSAAPYTCAWDTTAVGDGAYDLRAIATDNAANSTTSAVVTARVVDNRAPVVSLQDPGSYIRGTVSLQATATDAGTGVTSVAIQRSVADAGSWTTICTVTATPYTCTLNTKAGQTPDNDYDFRAVATDGAGNTASDLVSALVDNTAPSIALSVPGSPLRGVTSFSASPADAGSGIGDVVVQVSPAGTGSWTTACTTTGSPWSCSWDTTTVTPGSYDFRAIVTDVAGNSAASATTTRTVDNAVSSVFMNDPGTYLRGTATLQATVSNPAGSPSVRIQVSPSGAATWTTICTVTAAPWSCALDTTSRLDGPYDFRAVLTDASGTKTSNTVSSRIDNTLLRGLDVQSANAAIAGRLEPGDTLMLTYSEVVVPPSVAAGWDGAAPLPVAVRLRDGNLLGLTTKADTIDVFTDATLRTPVRLGSVNTRGDFVKGSKTAVFTGTLTRAAEGTTFTLTVGSLLSGTGLRTSSDRVLMTWTPSAGVTDVAGNVASTAPVTQSGVARVNF